MPRLGLLCATIVVDAHAASACAGSPTRSTRAVRAADLEASREALKERYQVATSPSTADYQRFGIRTMPDLDRATHSMHFTFPTLA